jgi:hypothetical protein
LGFESTIFGNLVNEGSIDDQGRMHVDLMSGPDWVPYDVLQVTDVWAMKLCVSDPTSEGSGYRGFAREEV